MSRPDSQINTPFPHQNTQTPRKVGGGSRNPKTEFAYFIEKTRDDSVSIDADDIPQGCATYGPKMSVILDIFRRFPPVF